MKKIVFGALTIALFAASCGRDPLKLGLTIKVVEKPRKSSPFEIQVESTSKAGMAIFLAPANTPRAQLESPNPRWPTRRTDSNGLAFFPNVEGDFDVMLDANNDGVADTVDSNVPSGGTWTMTLAELGNTHGLSRLQATTSKRFYRLGEKIRANVSGTLPVTSEVLLEIWHYGANPVEVYAIAAGQYGGDVSFFTSLPIDAAWPLTPDDSVDDYMLVPKAGGKYYLGARFSIRNPPVDDMSLLIDWDAVTTSTQLVSIQLTARNAASVALSETLTGLKNAERRPFSENHGYILSASRGIKTVYGLFFTLNGEPAGPVSDTIQLVGAAPTAPATQFVHVFTNPPGMHDFLEGEAGAVTGGTRVRVYADLEQQNLLGETAVAADGSFGLIDIGDGSAGNVQHPDDFVYLTAMEEITFTESAPSPITNDSTPPNLLPHQLDGDWINDGLGAGYGNPGDEFRARLKGDPDIVGGLADFSQMGGPIRAPLAPLGVTEGSYAANFTLPSNIMLQGSEFTYQMSVMDAAGNRSAWVSPGETYSIDTLPLRDPPVIHRHVGGNRTMFAEWLFPLPGAHLFLIWVIFPYFPDFDVEVRDEAGKIQNFLITPDDYSAIQCYFRRFGAAMSDCSIILKGSWRPGRLGDLVPVGPLENCHWYWMRVRMTSAAGNWSPYSNEVSDRVILPPPVTKMWTTVMSMRDTALTYQISYVPNASAYEMDFSTSTGAPYTYTSAVGSVSPMKIAPGDADPFVVRADKLPPRQTYYTSTRAWDGACPSDYGPERVLTTSLHVVAFTAGTTGETMGAALTRDQDFDGDGKPDIIVGSPGSGRIGAALAPAFTMAATFGTFNGQTGYDLPGVPLSTADIDGDGKDEFIVGSPSELVNGMIEAGAVRIYDDDRILLATFYGDKIGQQLGFATANLGDMNGDGAEEFAVGGFGCAHRDCKTPGTETLEGPGKVIVYDGGSLSAMRVHMGTAPGDYFGAAIAGLADVDGDGVRDYVISAPSLYGGTSTDQVPYALMLYSGASGQTLSIMSSESNVRLGRSLAPIGDIDGDNVPDLLVGMDYFGSIGVVRAVSIAGWRTLWERTGEMLNAGPGFGLSLSVAGDINGDGQTDVVVGAPGIVPNLFFGAGSAYVLDAKTGDINYEYLGSLLDGAAGYSVLSPGNIFPGPLGEWVVGVPGNQAGGIQAGGFLVLTGD